MILLTCTVPCISYTDFLPPTLFGASCRCNFAFLGQRACKKMCVATRFNCVTTSVSKQLKHCVFSTSQQENITNAYKYHIFWHMVTQNHRFLRGATNTIIILMLFSIRQATVELTPNPYSIAMTWQTYKESSNPQVKMRNLSELGECDLLRWESKLPPRQCLSQDRPQATWRSYGCCIAGATNLGASSSGTNFSLL